MWRKALTSSLNLDSVLQTIMEKISEYFRPDTWSLLMVDENKDELYFAIAVGPAAETLKALRLKVGEGIAGWVAKHGESLIVPDVYTDPRFAKRIDEMTKWQTRSIICIPLKSKHRTLGVIQLINCDINNFTDNEMFFLHALCDYAAIAVDNARAVERIQELTITDDVTGLYNARHLYKTLEAEVYRSARFGYQFTVVFLDLDHFKQVNDTHGHLVGSKLLWPRSASRSRHNCASSTSPSVTAAMSSSSCCRRRARIPASSWPSACAMASATPPFSPTRTCTSTCAASMGMATYPEDAKSRARDHPPGR